MTRKKKNPARCWRTERERSQTTTKDLCYFIVAESNENYKEVIK